MSSRRLAISSLLCDDDSGAPASTSPTREEHPTSQQHNHSRSYASPVRSALPVSPEDLNATRYDYRRHQSKPQDSPDYGHYPGSPMSPLQPTASTSRILHTAAASTVPQSSSPTSSARYSASIDAQRQSAHHHLTQRWEEGGPQRGSGEFPRAAHQPYATDQPRQPPPHPPIPSPLPSTAGSLLTSIQERRREPHHPLQISMSPYAHSPTQDSTPSSSNSQKFLLTPSQTAPSLSSNSPHSIRQLLNNDAPTQRSPVQSQRQELGVAPSRRPTTSAVSPVAPRSALPGGPSGLDLLMQAATAERERIDEHRRLSGGDEQRHASSSRPQPLSLSPVSFRTDTRLPLVSPAPLSASSRIGGYVQPEESDIRSQRYDSDIDRASKRRRSSPEPTQAEASDIHRYDVHAGTSFSRSSVRKHDYFEEEAPLPSPEVITRSPLVSTFGSPSFPQNEAVTEVQCSPRQSASSFSRKHPGTSEQQSVSVDMPTEPISTTYGRRSPPRSKPRPKKPGSAALALVEKEFREVALSDDRTRALYDNREESKSNEASVSQPDPPSKLHQKKCMARSSPSKEAAYDDEDVNDFFMSTFESPKLAEERVSSKTRPLIDSFDRYGGSTVDRGQHALLNKRLTPSSTSPSSEFARTMEAPHRSYLDPAADGSGDQVSVMDEVGDHLLDELADAAGAATSEDDRTEYDEQDTDTMEVDVENELLSLIDGPSEQPSKLHQQPISPHSTAEESGALNSPPEHVAPLPAPGPGKAKSTKKGVSKPRASKAKAEEPSDLTTKPKVGGKPRPTKGDKAKGGKNAKDSAGAPSSSLPTPDSARPLEDFPLVTSSGRMITKSKKSAAASASLVPEVKITALAKKKTPTAAAAAADGGSSRSRSHSAMPRASVDPDAPHEKSTKVDEEKPELVGEEDDKLYCICKTRYDEDRVMIACDRCDEWYHTQCINMPDLEVDLIDQFVCPNCIARNPELQLRTTYKQRCFSGLKHPEPDSAEACHKPSRGNFSKYCSDECGVRHLHRRLQAWSNQGGDVNGLWESVKDAKRREGRTDAVPNRKIPKRILAEMQNNEDVKADADMGDVKSPIAPLMPSLESQDSAVRRLDTQLQKIFTEREARKKELEVIAWRERLLQLASDRSEYVEVCGWDQRLCFGDEEIIEFGKDAIESYDDSHPPNAQVGAAEGEGMDVDEPVDEGEWWCPGKKKCDRHAGWQKLRATELKAQRDSNEEALARLTTRERDIRNRIEDIRHPQSRGTALKFSVKLTNGIEESRKKGKKKTVAALA